MSERINPYLENAIFTTVAALKDVAETAFYDEEMRFGVIAALVANLLQDIRKLYPAQDIQALQINDTQVLSFNGTPEIITVAQADASPQLYLSCKTLREQFNLDLQIPPFSL